MKLLRLAGIGLLVVATLAVLSVGVASAQQPLPPGGPYGPGGMMGNRYGIWGGRAQFGRYGSYGGGWMGSMHRWMIGTGGMHALVWEGLADALDITPEDLYAELAGGKTLTQVAEAHGLTQEQLAGALENAVETGLAQAVSEGFLTQDQADAMLEFMSGNYAWMIEHMGAGTWSGGTGCHGNVGTPANL